MAGYILLGGGGRSKMVAIVSYKADNKVYICSTENGELICSRDAVEAADKMTRQYNDRHFRSYEASMSNCIYHIQFQPRIHEIDETKLNRLSDDEIVVIPFRVQTVRSIAGHITGILCEGTNANKWHETGYSPDLITYKGQTMNAELKKIKGGSLNVIVRRQFRSGRNWLKKIPVPTRAEED
jgi:hypothetical protein